MRLFKYLHLQSILRYLRPLHIVWSLVRRRVTRRLTRLQTMYNVLRFSKNDKIISKNQFTGNATQPQRNVLKYFAIFKTVAHSLELGETPSYSASHQAPNYVQRS